MRSILVCVAQISMYVLDHRVTYLDQEQTRFLEHQRHQDMYCRTEAGRSRELDRGIIVSIYHKPRWLGSSVFIQGSNLPPPYGLYAIIGMRNRIQGRFGRGEKDVRVRQRCRY